MQILSFRPSEVSAARSEPIPPTCSPRIPSTLVDRATWYVAPRLKIRSYIAATAVSVVDPRWIGTWKHKGSSLYKQYQSCRAEVRFCTDTPRRLARSEIACRQCRLRCVVSCTRISPRQTYLQRASLSTFAIHPAEMAKGSDSRSGDTIRHIFPPSAPVDGKVRLDSYRRLSAKSALTAVQPLSYCAVRAMLSFHQDCYNGLARGNRERLPGEFDTP